MNDLKKSAEYAEEKLHSIEESGKTALQNSNHIDVKLTSIHHQTQRVEETSRNLQENVKTLNTFTEQVYERSKGITTSQEEMIQGQTKMRERLNEGMEMLHDSSNILSSEILILKNETREIEKQIGEVGEKMFSRMTTLQNRADDIENLTGTSLDNQKQLLQTQTAALEGLRLLTTFQSQALEESR